MQAAHRRSAPETRRAWSPRPGSSESPHWRRSPLGGAAETLTTPSAPRSAPTATGMNATDRLRDIVLLVVPVVAGSRHGVLLCPLSGIAEGRSCRPSPLMASGPVQTFNVSYHPPVIAASRLISPQASSRKDCRGGHPPGSRVAAAAGQERDRQRCRTARSPGRRRLATPRSGRPGAEVIGAARVEGVVAIEGRTSRRYVRA